MSDPGSPTAAPLVEATSLAAASEPASLAQTEPGLSADQRAALLAELAPLQLKLRELQGESLGVSDGDFSYSFD